MSKILFEEKQNFNQKWLWLLLIGISVGSISPLLYAFYKQIVLGIPWGSNPMSDAGIIIVLLLTIAFMSGLLLIFKTTTLLTYIDNKSIKVRFKPFTKEKTIYFSELEDYYIREYKSYKEYGGYGLRTGIRKKNVAYNTSGNQGLQLIFKNGDKLLIGTNNKEMLGRVISKIKNHEVINYQ